MDRESLIQGIREEMRSGKIRSKFFPMMAGFGVRDYSETVHTMGLNYVTAIGRTINNTTAISECPVYPYEKKVYSAEKVGEKSEEYRAEKEPTVRPDSIWYSTKDNQPLLICEFERYDNSRLKNKKLEEKIQNLLIAYHQLGGDVPLILFIYWTYPKVTPGDISKYLRIFDEGFTMMDGTKIYGINGRKTKYLVYHCVASGNKENLTFNQWIQVR